MEEGAEGEVWDGVVVPREAMPEVYVPGDVLHIYSERGLYYAAWVPFDFEDLSTIQPLPHMLKDHAASNVWDALREVCATRLPGVRPPPAWQPHHESDECACCHSHFTWASTLQSETQAARDKHNCRKCGLLCCAPCSTARIALPEMGLHEPSRVCDRCRFRIFDTKAGVA